MADIPIERKSRGPAWAWMILAVIVLALAAWYFVHRNQREAPAETSAATSAPAHSPSSLFPAENSGTITDLAALLKGSTQGVVGRAVRLVNVPAGSVPADAGFWVTGEGDTREYVILHEVLTPNTPIEGKIDVKEGDRLDIVGVVRSAAEGVPADAAIPGPTAPLPAGVEHYIDASSVTKAH